MRLYRSKGFTLIELLVVVAIIGILSSVVLASLNTARAKARDARRKSDLTQIRTAMEMYYDKYGTYTVTGTGYSGCGCGWAGYQDGGIYAKAVTRGLYENGFLGVPLVDDPIQNPGYMIYSCSSIKYVLYATLENPTASDIATATASCAGTVVAPPYVKNYSLSN